MEKMKSIIKLQKKILEDGYFDAAKDERTKNFSLVDLVRKDGNIESRWHFHYRYAYKLTTVEAYNGFDFKILYENKRKGTVWLPNHIYIYAKEVPGEKASSEND